MPRGHAAGSGVSVENMREDLRGTSTSVSGRIRLEALTGLRFVAAAHVLFFHGELARLPRLPTELRNLVGRGEESVGLFFLLSGFVLTYGYFEPVGDRAHARARFWWARFARIYPLYLLGLLLTLPIYIGDMMGDPGPVVMAKAVAGVMALGLVQAWLPETALRWNFPAWSLSDEAFFYAIFPLFAALGRGLRRQWLLGTIGVLWLLSEAPSAVHQLLGQQGLILQDSASAEWWLSLIRYNPVARLPEFLMGIAVGRIFLDRSATGPRREGVASGGLLSMVAGVGIVVLLALPAPPNAGKGVLTLFFALLVYALALGGGPLAWLLSRSWMVSLGEASYALYILHHPVLHWTFATGVLMFSIRSPHSLPFYLVSASIAVGVSLLSHRLIELPARRALLRLLSSRGAIPPRDARHVLTAAGLSGER
jgi:peptidoglycan/LPS O-acetylase OafA/YrhL